MNPAKNEQTLKNTHNSSVRYSFAYFESWYLQLSKVDVHSRFAISMYLWKAGQWNERVTVENNKKTERKKNQKYIKKKLRRWRQQQYNGTSNERKFAIFPRCKHINRKTGEKKSKGERTHRKGRHEQMNKKERERLDVVHDTKCKRKQFCYRIDAANILLFYVLPMPSSTWMSILSLIDNRLLHTTCIPICIDIFFQRQQPAAIATQHHLHFVADNAHRWKKLKRSKTEEINNEFTIF